MVGIVIEHPEAKAERLFRQARAGDHQAFGEIVKQHESMVFSIALHALRDGSLAEELAQDVFLKLYRSLGRIECASHLTFWLRRVTTHRCIDQLRRMRQLGIPMDDAPDQLVLGDQADYLLQKRLRGLVAALPPKQRLAVILRYEEELDPVEISRVMRIPLNTVKSHLRRALAALRLRMGVQPPADHAAQAAELEL